MQIAIENTESTYGKCGVDLERGLAGAHEIGFLHELLGIRTSHRLVPVVGAPFGRLWQVMGLLQARVDALTTVLVDNAIGMEVGLDGKREFASGAKLVLVDGHVLDSMFAGSERLAGLLFVGK